MSEISLANFTTGIKPEPRRTIVYGDEGIGKTTFLSKFPNTFLIPAERGVSHIEDASKPSDDKICQSFDELMAYLEFFYVNESPCQHISIEGVSGVQRLIDKQVCKDERKSHIEEIGYNGGRKLGMRYWEKLIEALDALGRDKRMNVSFSAHVDKENFKDPTTDSYDRYSIRAWKGASDMLFEWGTEVLFCQKDILTRKEDAGFNKTTTKAIESKSASIYTTSQPAFRAKNRLSGIPEKIAMDWYVYKDFLPAELLAE